MRTLLLLLLSTAADDASEAGSAYKQGLEELKKGRYAQAVLKFQIALRHEPKETPKLQYRDKEGRHDDPYYPHYSWAQARLLEAEREPATEKKRPLLQEALAHAALTSHPQGADLQKQATAALAKVETPAPARVEDPFAGLYAALRRKVDDLCVRDRFEEAFQVVNDQARIFKDRAPERDELVALIRNRQKAKVEGYEQFLRAGLQSLLATDPTEKADSVLPLLKPARVPREVQREPAAPLGWLEGFVDLYEREIGRVRKAASLDAAQAVQAAEAFEEAARKGLEANFFAGFQAARHVARSIRQARLAAAGVDDAAAADPILAASEAASRRWEKELRQRLERPGPSSEQEAMKGYVEEEIAADTRQAAALRARYEERARGRERLRQSIRAAEAALSDPKVMVDEARLRKVGQDTSKLEEDPLFVSLPREMRAQAAFVRALAEATAATLEGAPADAVAERCREAVLKAHALDPKVEAAWRERLSPKVVAALNRIKRS